MAKIGDFIRIEEMVGEPAYTGKTGIIQHIDDAGQIHGTWGGCALLPEVDRFTVLVEDRGEKPAILQAGQIYRNRGGETMYRCLDSKENENRDRERKVAVLQTVKTRWTFDAIGVVMFPDGTMEWDHSQNGRSEEASEDQCPFGGDTENDCADCAYSDYHFVDGECVQRELK